MLFLWLYLLDTCKYSRWQGPRKCHCWGRDHWDIPLSPPHTALPQTPVDSSSPGWNSSRHCCRLWTEGILDLRWDPRSWWHSSTRSSHLDIRVALPGRSSAQRHSCSVGNSLSWPLTSSHPQLIVLCQRLLDLVVLDSSIRLSQQNWWWRPG